MFDIDELIEVISRNNGSASIDEICKYFTNNLHVEISALRRKRIFKNLCLNSSRVRFNMRTNRWEILTFPYGETNLHVSDNIVFVNIKKAMKAIFDKNVESEERYFRLNETNNGVWFTKNSAKNTLLEDGTIWFERPLNDYDFETPDDELRYTFLETEEGYKFVGVFKFDRIEGNTRIYKLIDDKVQKARKNLFICNIGYLKYYNGITPEDNFQGKGGGSYVVENNEGGERYNFRERGDGKNHGFVETNYRRGMTRQNQIEYANEISLESINSNFRDSDTAENVRVVFISYSPTLEKNVVVGWYENATVYRRRQDDFDNRPYGYNISCNSNDAHLIHDNDRTFIYPKKNNDGTTNFGQRAVSYPYSKGQVTTTRLANELNNYIDYFPTNYRN